jgi:feruloyl esterase
VSPGTELGWAQLIAGPQPFALATEMFKHVVHQEPNWDWHTFDVSRDTATADAQYGATLNADSADLRAFRERGGKILMWHGWADALVPPQATIDYFQDVVRTVGSSADDFVKLFMAPGVSHCGGGSGPNQFNAIAAIERWREAGIAPVELIASRVNDSRVDLTRPLCPFPQVAQYQGMGTPSDAANFRCKAP